MNEEYSSGWTYSGLKRSPVSAATTTPRSGSRQPGDHGEDVSRHLFAEQTEFFAGEIGDFGAYALNSLRQLKTLIESVSSPTGGRNGANRSSSSSNNTISSANGATVSVSVPESSVHSSNRNSSTSSASASSASASANSSRQNLAAAVVSDTSVTTATDDSHQWQCQRSFLANLHELIDLWTSMEQSTEDMASRQFVELLIAKKLNYLSNSMLGLERRMLPAFLSSPAASLLAINDSYARYDQLEADIGPGYLMRVALEVNNLLGLRSLGK